MTVSKPLRIRRNDRERLKAIQRSPNVKELVGRHRPTYDDILKVVLPEPTEETIISRPERDMVFIRVIESHAKVTGLAGKNVPAHEVIEAYLNEFFSKHEIEEYKP